MIEAVACADRVTSVTQVLQGSMSEGQFLLWPSVCYVHLNPKPYVHDTHNTPHDATGYHPLGLVATDIPSPFCRPRGGDADRAVGAHNPSVFRDLSLLFKDLSLDRSLRWRTQVCALHQKQQAP